MISTAVPPPGPDGSVVRDCGAVVGGGQKDAPRCDTVRLVLGGRQGTRTLTEVLAIVKCQTALPSGLMHHLVGTAEIADLLAVSRQRVHQLTSRKDFPAPVAVLASATIWEREAVEEWARRTGRQHARDEA